VIFASLIWSVLTAIVRSIYRLGLRRAKSLPVRVISVGNFEVGGTGKTPVVAKIAREALSRGLHPVILSRGYGGQWERSGGVIAPSQDTGAVDPQDSGDEASLLHELVPGAWIGVGADRFSAFFLATERAKQAGQPVPDFAILDDGLQHHQLSRDLDVILMTSARPWQKIFREFPSLNRQLSTLFIWSKGERSPVGIRTEDLTVRIRWAVPKPDASLGMVKLWLVTGVADGRHVRDLLSSNGWSVAAFSEFRDHASYSRDLLDQLLHEAESKGLILATTGKDWVKWKAQGIQREKVRVFEPEIEFDQLGSKLWSHRLWGDSL